MTKTEIRVRYAETDQMGITYYANYFVWMEVARTDYLRQKGYNYRDLEKNTGIRLAVLDASCKYKSPIYYDDVVTIETTITELKRLKIKFKYQLKRGDALLAEAETTLGSIDSSGKPLPIPSDVLEALSTDIVHSSSA